MIPRTYVLMLRYPREEAEAAVAASNSYAEVLRRLGLRAAGGNHAPLRRYVDQIWRIPTHHFGTRPRVAIVNERVPLQAILVKDSTFSRRSLKQRLYSEGLKERSCEFCGQTELWYGCRMSLILDHINGIHDDNRLENLRILCPNCAATLDTHCGRKKRFEDRLCEGCGQAFHPRSRTQCFCSRACGCRHNRRRRGPQPHWRKVPRPPLEQLLEEVESLGFLGTGRLHGVSDQAIRKWIRAYRESEEK